jgi:hypothetical protein
MEDSGKHINDDDEACTCPSCGPTLPVYEEGVCGRVVALPPITAKDWRERLNIVRDNREIVG